MRTKTKYEEIALKELREIPEEARPHIISILRSFREIVIATKAEKKEKESKSGLNGIWEDDRSAQEIIADIHAHRTGFCGRQIEL